MSMFMYNSLLHLHLETNIVGIEELVDFSFNEIGNVFVVNINQLQKSMSDENWKVKKKRFTQFEQCKKKSTVRYYNGELRRSE